MTLLEQTDNEIRIPIARTRRMPKRDVDPDTLSYLVSDNGRNVLARYDASSTNLDKGDMVFRGTLDNLDLQKIYHLLSYHGYTVRINLGGSQK